MIIILGSSRSGTTWLGKIFDSHPDVIYLHEPDSILVNREIPFQVNEDELEEYITSASIYISQLLDVKNIKVSGSLPMFKKNYRNALMHLFRNTYVYSSKTLQRCIGAGKLRTIGVPDLFSEEKKSTCRHVIKSVDSLNRAHLFSRAMPNAHILHLIRHPCGYVASRLRGIKLSLLGSSTFMASISRMPEARKRGLTLDYLERLSVEEQLACHWMIQNEKTINDMEGEDNYKLVIYDELCQNPIQVTKALFRFSALDWNSQTEEFIRLCQNARNGKKGYFQVIRNPAKAAFQWKNELDRSQISRIMDFVADSAPGRIFKD
jgi:hypothetical protein